MSDQEMIWRLRNEVENGKGAGFADTEDLLNLVEAQHEALELYALIVDDVGYETDPMEQKVIEKALRLHAEFDAGGDDE